MVNMQLCTLQMLSIREASAKGVPPGLCITQAVQKNVALSETKPPL